MGAYHITGGVPLCGEIRIHGAKNSALPILAATLLTKGRCILHNCPAISDVEAALDILRCLGCRAEREGETVWVDTYAANNAAIPVALMQKMRAAIIFLGALLTRFGEARLSQPGGCSLGDRPIDLHLLGLRHMGVRCEYEGESLICKVERLQGCTVALPFPSVGATENLLLAALGCTEEIVICNAAKEPEITDFIGFLRTCGAEIDDLGSVLRIRGGKMLHGAEYGIVPDRMEAATYLTAAAITRGELTLKQLCPSHLTAVTAVLRKGGCEICEKEGEMTLHCHRIKAVSPIRTEPYDGFPTDAQAPMMALLATAKGVSVMEETIFSDRFRHVPALCAMGANIHATKRYAIIEGVERLHGACVQATDLRGGAAMVLAALAAEGESCISHTEHMERGYADFVQVLQSVGAQITTE